MPQMQESHDMGMSLGVLHCKASAKIPQEAPYSLLGMSRDHGHTSLATRPQRGIKE
jgi:hypothetical protein